jgi:hypothetical protein
MIDRVLKGSNSATTGAIKSFGSNATEVEESFKDQHLESAFQGLQLKSVVDDDDAAMDINFRPSKRLRLSTDDRPHTSLSAVLVEETYRLLGSQAASDLDGLHLVAL